MQRKNYILVKNEYLTDDEKTVVSNKRMGENSMKIKEGYILDTIGDQKVAVSLNYSENQFSGMVKLNSVGAFLWEKLSKDTEEEALVQEVKKKYAVEEERARKDIAVFLKNLEDNGILER